MTMYDVLEILVKNGYTHLYKNTKMELIAYGEINQIVVESKEDSYCLFELVGKHIYLEHFKEKEMHLLKRIEVSAAKFNSMLIRSILYPYISEREGYAL